MYKQDFLKECHVTDADGRVCFTLCVFDDFYRKFICRNFAFWIFTLLCVNMTNLKICDRIYCVNKFDLMCIYVLNSSVISAHSLSCGFIYLEMAEIDVATLIQFIGHKGRYNQRTEHRFLSNRSNQTGNW